MQTSWGWHVWLKTWRNIWNICVCKIFFESSWKINNFEGFVSLDFSGDCFLVRYTSNCQLCWSLDIIIDGAVKKRLLMPKWGWMRPKEVIHYCQKAATEDRCKIALNVTSPHLPPKSTPLTLITTVSELHHLNIFFLLCMAATCHVDIHFTAGRLWHVPGKKMAW
jgi:hypothetical protein